ncbi:MAG: response regulator transcription factor [Subdoligranulum sp.]|nr:response regulator transcription factor [Subdoligranulum sp.]
MAKILIAEDEKPINELIRRNLTLVGHTAAQAWDGVAALEMAGAGHFDLVLLDVMLPGYSGFEVKERLDPDTPVIFVTARGNLSDRLQGLGLGADDYIVKPFEILELLARVEAVLRRVNAGDKTFDLDGCHVDFGTYRVFLDGEEVPLAPREFSLLETLIRNRNLALTRDQLLEQAWGYDYEGDDRTVDVHIQKLRKKLRMENRIQTVYKVGYRLSTK